MPTLRQKKTKRARSKRKRYAAPKGCKPVNQKPRLVDKVLPESYRTGRPSLYRPDFHPAEYIRLSEKGYTSVQCAAEWSISKATLINWVHAYPEFLDAVQIGHAKHEAYLTKVGLEGRRVRVEVQDPRTGKIKKIWKYQQVNPYIYALHVRNGCNWKTGDNMASSPQAERLQGPNIIAALPQPEIQEQQKTAEIEHVYRTQFEGDVLCDEQAKGGTEQALLVAPTVMPEVIDQNGKPVEGSGNA